MADVLTHLAVAKRYLEKNGGIKNARDFYDGNILPDMCELGEDEASHYGKRDEFDDLVKRAREKVGINKFLEMNVIDNDIMRGKLLHLYTDYEYYTTLIPQDYLRNVNHKTLLKDLNYAKGFFDKHLAGKYGVGTSLVSFKDTLDKKLEIWGKRKSDLIGTNAQDRKLLYDANELDAFIERVSSVDFAKQFAIT